MLKLLSPSICILVSQAYTCQEGLSNYKLCMHQSTSAEVSVKYVQSIDAYALHAKVATWQPSAAPPAKR